MAIVSEVEVSDSYWKQDRRQYDYAGKRHEKTHYYDAANLANDPAYLPSRFQITIHLEGDVYEPSPSPEKWLKDARLIWKFANNHSAGIDVFDLPGLQRMQLIDPDEDGMGVCIVLDFVDFTEVSERDSGKDEAMGVKEFNAEKWLKRVQHDKSMHNAKEDLRQHLEREQEVWKEAMEADSVNEAFADAIIAGLHMNGMMNDNAALLSLRRCHDLDEQHAEPWLKAISEYLQRKENALARDSVFR